MELRTGLFHAVARALLLAVLQYRPPPVESRTEVIDRVGCGDDVRETVMFST